MTPNRRLGLGVATTLNNQQGRMAINRMMMRFLPKLLAASIVVSAMALVLPAAASAQSDLHWSVVFATERLESQDGEWRVDLPNLPKMLDE